VNAIQIEAEVGQDHRLVEALPPEVPVGRVKLVIEPLSQPSVSLPHPLTREEARAKLLAAGFLVTDFQVPEGHVPLSPQERLQLGQLPPGSPSIDDLINDDRGDY